MRKTETKNKAEAISQIIILIISIIAISWIIGGEIKIVEAAEPPSTECPNYCGPDQNVYNGVFSQGICIRGSVLKEKCSSGCSLGVCQEKFSLNKGITTLSSLYGGYEVTKKGTVLAKKALGLGSKTALGSTTATETVTGIASPAELTATTKIGIQWFGPVKGTSWLVGGGTAKLATALTASAAWGGVAFLLGRYIFGPWLGLTTQQSQALGYSLAGGAVTAFWAGGPIGIAVGVVLFFALAKKSANDIIQIVCYQWDAQSGKGLTETQRKQRCEMCNNQGDFACTEYQCRSLGQGCILINEENTGRQLCIWNNTKDINPPLIMPWEDALLDNFKYTPDNTISPPDRGVKITYTGTESVTTDGNIRCAPAFTQLSFGVKLDEPAKCKINPLKLSSYDEMADYFMGRGIRDYNQSFTLSLPSTESLEAGNISLDNGGKYELYVRCEDANGNANIANFVFKFCISEGPDTTPPLIVSTSILNNQPIAFGQSSINLNLYVNEPSECRWSRLDKVYDLMENNMTCATSVSEINAQMLYTCTGNLTGLKDRENNAFYFRCKDQPYLKGTDKESNRNANTQSYPLTLVGTQPLVIDEVGPIGIIRDATEVVKVELTAHTSAGFDEGKSICSFSQTGKSGTYADFFYGYGIEPFTQFEHKQELWLTKGNYTFSISCKDKGGNIDKKNVSFSVDVDKLPPSIIRAYKEDNYLKLITSESGKCVYSNFGCTYLFEDGTEMTSFSSTEHYTDWNINTDFYIKCEDQYGNRPLPNACNIIARPFEIPELQ